METLKLEEVFPKTEDFKLRFETIQQICDLLADLINNFTWSLVDKNQLVYLWTQTIKVYWSLCEQAGITLLPKA